MAGIPHDSRSRDARFGFVDAGIESPAVSATIGGPVEDSAVAAAVCASHSKCIHPASSVYQQATRVGEGSPTRPTPDSRMAGWCSTARPWDSIYGPPLRLAQDESGCVSMTIPSQSLSGSSGFRCVSDSAAKATQGSKERFGRSCAVHSVFSEAAVYVFEGVVRS